MMMMTNCMRTMCEKYVNKNRDQSTSHNCQDFIKKKRNHETILALMKN